VLASAEAALQRTFSLVAGSVRRRHNDRSLRGAFINGGRRRFPCPGGAHVATRNRRQVKISLTFQAKPVHTADGMTELGYRGRRIQTEHILYTRADRRASQRQPPQFVEEAVGGLAVAATQRSFMRYGLPRPVADARPRWPDHATAGELGSAQSVSQPSSTGDGARGSDTDASPAAGSTATRISAGSAHGQRSAVQQFAGTASLSEVRATGWRAP